MSTGRKHKQYLARAHAMGGSTLLDAEPARQVIGEMYERMSYSAIARAVGTSHTYIRLIHLGKVKRIAPDRMAAIIAVRRHTPTDTSHVNARGTVRRLQALNALGYTWQALADETGYSLTGLKSVVAGKWDVVEASNAAAVAEAYERLSMRLPVGDTPHERSAIGAARNSARRKGWAPPLAWDCIDTDPHPMTGPAKAGHDHVVVERILAGDMSLAKTASKPEKVEVVRRWRDSGRTLNELERLTGWEPRRYLTKEVA